MRAGLLRDLVEVQEPIEAKNSFGELEVDQWRTLRRIWARVEPLRGIEKFSEQQTKSNIDTKVTTRYMHCLLVTPKMRVKFGKRTLDVDAVIDVDGRRRTLEISCKEAA